MEILLKSGAVLMLIALALAWLLVAVKYLGLFGGLFTNAKYLLSAHLDYIFMAILNWLVFALFNQQDEHDNQNSSANQPERGNHAIDSS